MRRRTIIATTIGLIVVGLLFRFSLMTYALYAMALAYIISVAFARTSLDGARCARRIATDRAEIGDSLDVHAHLHNDKLPSPSSGSRRGGRSPAPRTRATS